MQRNVPLMYVNRTPRDGGYCRSEKIRGFTASTSFANPAVTVARSISDTFAGIAPLTVPGLILAQLAGMLAAVMLARWLFSASSSPRPLRPTECEFRDIGSQAATSPWL
jgi:hypothetical protein